MALLLDDMRAEYARKLAEDPARRFSMDKTFAHCITVAYEAGIAAGKATLIDTINECDNLQNLALSLLDPERFGHAVTEEVRDEARRVLGIKKVVGGGTAS